MNKICSKCKLNLPFDNFHKNKAGKHGLHSVCRVCKNTIALQRIHSDPQLHRDRNNAWYHRNSEKVSERYFANSDVIKNKVRQNYLNNRSYYLSIARSKAKHIRIATPSWANLEDIRKFYVTSENLTKETGIRHSVDHIIPLRGKTVCGLHTPSNLRVIPLKDNISKSNKLLEIYNYE